MYHLYNFAVHIASFALKIVAFFNPKIRLFVNGRRATSTILKKHIAPKDKVLWIHTASLGEFEQGLPIIEKLKTTYPSHKLLVSFFSPSGYEIKKNSTIADCVVYLPLDTKKNVSQFLEIVNPQIAIFVKYEIWPGYLDALRKGNIPTILVSALFKKEQVFFKWHGHFLRNSLGAFSHFFVQDNASQLLLNSIGFNDITISGDTRFDRVSKIVQQDNHLEFMSSFTQGTPSFVAGSTWPEDDAVLVPHINTAPAGVKYILAPHNIKKEYIDLLRTSISKKTVLYSEIQNKDLSSYDVMIIDTIGLLTKIYSYANIAYVGGGFGSKGLHNTLEPAVFGIPVIIGPHYGGFKEAEDLVALKGILVTDSPSHFNTLMERLLSDTSFLQKTGKINADHIQKSKGATDQIMAYIKAML